jgi:hypothetical protein
MKEQKPIGPGSGEQSSSRQGTENTNGTRGIAVQKPLRSETDEQKSPSPGSPMQSDVQGRKGRGRLNREVLHKLGKTLEAYFDDVRKEGVPDRFKELLRQYDERKDKESS